MDTFFGGRVTAICFLAFLWAACLGLYAFGDAALAGFLVGPAHAQEQAATTVFDFGPLVAGILDLVAPAVATVVSLLAVWVLRKLASWLNLQIDSLRWKSLQGGIANGVRLAAQKVGDEARGGIPINVKHEAIYIAASYAERSYPDAINYFGINSDRLDEMVEAEMSELFVTETSPDKRVSKPIVFSSF